MNGCEHTVTKKQRERLREHLLRAGESGSLLVLSDKRASGNAGTSSPSSPEVLVSSWLRLGGGVLQQSSGRTMGAAPSLASRGIWSSGRKECPLEGHKGGQPPDPRASGHVVAEGPGSGWTKGPSLAGSWQEAWLPHFLPTSQWSDGPSTSLSCKLLPLHKTRDFNDRWKEISLPRRLWE